MSGESREISRRSAMPDSERESLNLFRARLREQRVQAAAAESSQEYMPERSDSQMQRVPERAVRAAAAESSQGHLSEGSDHPTPQDFNTVLTQMVQERVEQELAAARSRGQSRQEATTTTDLPPTPQLRPAEFARSITSDSINPDAAERRRLAEAQSSDSPYVATTDLNQAAAAAAEQHGHYALAAALRRRPPGI